jgi:PAS domain S-box-containing protein
MSIQKTFVVLLALILIDLAALVVVSLLSSSTHRRIEAAERRRYASYKLADELRQSSDDLTRMVRSYVVSGDRRFEDYFYQILDIRNGKAERPHNYDRIYWDFISAGVAAPVGGGEKSALEARMAQAGFTSEEFAKLRDAQANSDGLVGMEEVAMHAMKGQFEDGRGGFTRTGPPDPAMAQGLVFGERYHAEKARIMRPIDDFIGMIESRTSHEVAQLRRRGTMLGQLSVLLLVPGILLTAMTFGLMKRWVLRPLRTLERGAQDVGRGRLDLEVPVARDDEFGQVARAFNDMAANLKRTTVSKDYFDGIFSSMLNTVLVMDVAPGAPAGDAILRTVNPAVERLLGWQPSELVGRPLGQILPQGADADWLGRVIHGQSIVGDERQLRTRGGETVPVLLAASRLSAQNAAVQQVVCVAQDLTERKLAEAATREKDRLRQDLDTAKRIQNSLLPKSMPEVEGFDIAGWSEPAEQTGGDYFDWLQLPDGRMVVGIGDATGHGIGPALLVTVCRSYFRAATMLSSELEIIANHVNNLLTMDMPAGRFITAAVGLLEPARRRLLLYSAGHGPIFFFREKTSHVEVLEADDMPLGLSVNEESEVGRVFSLSPGDTIVLITDGFFEWMNPQGETFGIRRFADMIRTHRSLSAGPMIERFRAEVLEFARGVPQADDLTAVVIKCVK